LGIGYWGLVLGPIPNPQSPIPNPQSPFNNIIYNFKKNNYLKKLNLIILALDLFNFIKIYYFIFN
jgi:hypothetical protein